MKKRLIHIGYFSVLTVLVIFTYGFVDPHLVLSSSLFYRIFQTPLHSLVFEHKNIASFLYAVLVGSLFGYYVYFLKRLTTSSVDHLLHVRKILVVASVLLIFSFPAFSYDIFNYILTAKMVTDHKENPYIVTPTEIPNEPALVYTRAANKVALYGPTWIVLTLLPSVLGNSSIWRTIVFFKAVTLSCYLLLIWLIYKRTGALWNVVFFAFNPLVLSEVLISGHNDIVMMVFSIGGLLLLTNKKRKRKVIGILLLVLSFFVKGATLGLLPVLLYKPKRPEALWALSFWVMFCIFLLTPLREELYPWYAVWFLPFAALLPKGKAFFIQGFSIAVSFGLSLRHLPYILTREYGGAGPLERVLFTFFPVSLFLGWYIFNHKEKLEWHNIFL